MKPLVGFVTLVLLFCSSIAIGQAEQETSIGYPALTEVSYNYFGGSARAMAMGYAFVGLSNDVSSGLWNPAGLWILEGPMVSASYNIYSPAGQFEHNWLLMETYDLNPDAKTADNNLNMDAIGHFSFVAPVRIKGHPWVFTFNYARNNEFSRKTDWLTELTNDLPIDTYVDEKGHQRNFNVGAGTRVYKQLSVGFTLNIFDASRVYDNKHISVRDTIIDPVYGTTAELAQENRLIDSTKSNGFNFNLGLMFKEEKYSIGAVIHTPFTIKHASDRSMITMSTLNGLVNVDNSLTEYVVDSLAKQDVPLSVILGGAFFANENLTLTADIAYQNYGSTKWYYNTVRFFEPNGERTDYYEEIPIDWNNTIGAGVGAEYMLDSKYGRIPLRAGFRYDQLPQPANVTFVTTDVGYRMGDADTLEAYQLAAEVTTRTAKDRQSSTSFSLGTGIHWNQIELDIAYMYTAGAELNLVDEMYFYDEDSEGNPEIWKFDLDRKWERKTHEFRFTFTGYF